MKPESRYVSSCKIPFKSSCILIVLPFELCYLKFTFSANLRERATRLIRYFMGVYLRRFMISWTSQLQLSAVVVVDSQRM